VRKLGSIEEWIKRTEEIKKFIEKLKPKDRLEIVSAINDCNAAINASTLGWQSWVQAPKVMNSFDEKELLEIFEYFRKKSLDFLEQDMRWTKELQKKMAEQKKKGKETTYIQKENYIS